MSDFGAIAEAKVERGSARVRRATLTEKIIIFVQEKGEEGKEGGESRVCLAFLFEDWRTL